MDSDLQIILEFLARSGTEVEARTVGNPDVEEASLLIRFATGVCSKEERAQACNLIRIHPNWLGWVSHRVKAQRNDPPPNVTRDVRSHGSS